MWEVAFCPEFLLEYNSFSAEVQDEIASLVMVLEQFGPHLARPHCDTLKGSSISNLKELRFSADRGEWRVAYAFDPERKAILLVAGDKSGISKNRFYRFLIETAQKRFKRHLENLVKGKNGHRGHRRRA